LVAGVLDPARQEVVELGVAPAVAARLPVGGAQAVDLVPDHDHDLRLRRGPGQPLGDLLVLGIDRADVAGELVSLRIREVGGVEGIALPPALAEEVELLALGQEDQGVAAQGLVEPGRAAAGEARDHEVGAASLHGSL
jgi:hypothetical protein